MARARNIKPSFFKNELLVEMGPFDRLLFIGLWCLADREGRTEDRPKRIKMELFPCDSYDVEQGLAELQRGGFIKRYEAAGVRVIAIANFLKHQTPHGTEKDSQLPDEDGEFTVHERQSNGYSTGKKRKNNVKTDQINVDPPLDDGGPDVKTQAKNTLNPDSLNPDSFPHTPKGADADNGEDDPEDDPAEAVEPKHPPAEPKPEAKTAAVSIQAWLAVCKAQGVMPVPEDDPVFAYAESVGIPDDMLTLAWREFRVRYSEPGAKRYRDWRSVFRKAVRGNWLKLWYVTEDGGYELTSVGKQAQLAMAARRREVQA